MYKYMGHSLNNFMCDMIFLSGISPFLIKKLVFFFGKI